MNGVETPLFGREAELAQLMDTFDSVVEHRVLSLVMLVGDAGLGKTRLMSELERWLDARPEPVWLFQGRAQPYSTNVPYGLLRGLFGWRFEILDNDTQAVAHAKLAEGLGACFGDRADEQIALIGQLIGLDYSANPHIAGMAGDGRQLRDRAFHAVTQYFRRLLRSGSAPAVVLLDDLHWADEGSLDFIDHMAQTCRDLPMMVLCLTRPALDERRPLWHIGKSRVHRIDLGPLSKLSSDELVESLLRRLEPVPVTLRDVVTSNAEGNPYFIEELVAMLIDDGAIVADGDRWHVAADKLVEVHIPSTLAGVLQARLDGLPSAEKMALQQASVIGHVFWDEPLERIAPGVTRALEGLLRRDLVRAREPSSFDGVREFAFKHHLLHQVTYDSVLKADKRRQHRLTAEWLVATSGERSAEFYGLIADHFERATDTASAAGYWYKAAEVAARTYATDAALSYLDRTLDLTPLGELGTRCDVIRRRIHLLNLTGRRREEETQISELERLADMSNDDARRADAVAVRARLAVFTGDNQAAASTAERALALAEKSGNTAAALLARSVWASAALALGDHARARVLAEELLGTARAAGDQRRTIDALHLQGSLAVHEGRYGMARQHFEQALQLARAIPEKVFEGVQLHNLGDVERALGNYAVAMEQLETGLQISRDVGAAKFVIHFLMELAEVSNARDDSEAALGFAAEGLTLVRDVSNRNLEARLLVIQGDAQAVLGRLSDAADSYHRALVLYRELGGAKVPLEPFAGLARVAAALGSIEDALAHVGLVEGRIDAGDDPNGAPELLWACYTALDAARSPRANEVLVRAHSVLTERASLLGDADRATFLGHVPAHRAIVAAWAALRRAPPR
jgi:tetratricopeptide (TPR) repeat protein